ncbi:response regulator [Deltaproteobacteria bacterium TL4]
MPSSDSVVALLVDDEPYIRDFLSKVLGRNSICTHQASNGQEALEVLKQQHIDLIITDVRMPFMDGIQLTRQVRKEYPEMPIVVLSGFTDEEMVIAALRGGANNFLNKPVDHHEFLHVILPLVAIIEQRRTQIFDYRLLQKLSGEICLGNDLKAIPATVDFLVQHLKTGPYTSRLHGLKIGLQEMLVNAIEHGNLAITNAEKEEALEKGTFEKLLQERLEVKEYQSRKVSIQYEFTPAKALFKIIDAGKGFDWLKFADEFGQSRLMAKSGKGILFARLYCDEVHYDEKGTQVSLVINNEEYQGDDQEVMSVFENRKNKILVVDDEPMVFTQLQTVLQEWGYTAGFISQPSFLFPRLEKEDFDLILMDIHMPEMNGVELLKQLKVHSAYQNIPIVMLTGEGNQQLIANCFEMGAEDYLTKPFNHAVLKARISSIIERKKSYNKIHRMNSELSRQYRALSDVQGALEKRHQQVQEDIQLASKIQKATFSLLPDPGFLKTSLLFIPHSIVSGDVYYASAEPNGDLFIFLGDVTGHGVSAAFMTIMVRMILENMEDSETYHSNQEILLLLNEKMNFYVPKGDYIVGVDLTISPTGMLTACSAGGPPFLILSDRSEEPISLTTGGQALGMFAKVRIPYVEESFQLKAGDKVILFTDGILEWRNKAQVSFGSDRLSNFLMSHKTQEIGVLLAGLLKEVQDFAQECPCQDDFTVLGFEFLG